MSKKLDSPKKKCEHKDTSPSSDPLIWYICHDCGAHLNQRFEVIPSTYHAIVNDVLKTEKKECKEYEPNTNFKICPKCHSIMTFSHNFILNSVKLDGWGCLPCGNVVPICPQCGKLLIKIERGWDCNCGYCIIPIKKDSGGDNRSEGGRMFEQLPSGEKSHPSDIALSGTDSKLPDLICPFCGRKLIRYKQAWICGHGCTKPALKPIDDLEKDSRSEKELPNRETVFCEASYGINGKPNVSSSKLPELCKKKDVCMSYTKQNLICNETPEICGWNQPKEKLPEPICPKCGKKSEAIPIDHSCGIGYNIKEDFYCSYCGYHYNKPKEKTELEKDPYGIEGKYGVWTKQELINECNVLVSNMDALHELHLKEKGELIEEFLRKMVEIYFSLGDTKVENLMFAELKQEYEGRLKK